MENLRTDWCRASPRKNGPFVAINCASVPEQPFESELFGYERGAFTGAQQAKAGQIELASTGVLFLDEVGEMSPMSQAKLLRVLQEREFRRLGGTRLVKANVRVIAASNRDLRQAVSDGSFREDLFYRLQVFDIRIPPLRERRGDIPLLADAFLREFERSSGCSSAGLTPDALATLVGHDWPGNVRELYNALERAVILCEMFVNAMRKGKHMGVSRPILPPMPWQDLAVLSDADLIAVYTYLRTIPPIVNHVPDPIPSDNKS
jgi:transcriptional regulator with PAS, ATPase and Fis domain